MRLLDRISLVLVLALAGAFALTELAEADLHWHLLAGREILATGQVPHQDEFSYVSAGRPWIDLHWLFQVGVALTYRLAGWGGLDLLKIVLLVFACGLAGLTARRRGVPRVLVAGLGLAALLASQERFNLRPEAASYVFLALVLLLIDQRETRPGRLWAIPPLLVLWANTHALFAVGLAAILIVVAGDALERWVRQRGGEGSGAVAGQPGAGVGGVALEPAIWRLPAVAGLSAAATLLTPYGIHGWLLPARLLFERIGSDNVYARSIAEFQPTLGGFGVTTAIGAFALLVGIVVIAGLIQVRRARPADLLLAAAFLYLGLLARRNAPLFALVALPLGGLWVAEIGRRIQRRIESRSRRGDPVRLAHAAIALTILALVLVSLWQVVSNRFYERDGTQRYFGRGAAPGFYPETAASFVLEHRLPGEAIHDLSLGGYLAWRWFPERRVFIDGRLEVHDPGLFVRYLKLQADPVVFEEVARRFGVEVVLPRFRPEWTGLLRHLVGGGGWRPVHVDHAAAVFVRDEQGGPSTELPAVDLQDPELGRRVLEEVRGAAAASAARDPFPVMLRTIIPRRAVPVAEVNAALFFAMAGAHANAELLFREALAKSPSDPRLHYDLGLVLEQAGRGAEARLAFETALRHDPGFAPARVAYAICLDREGDADGALREWARAERQGVLGPRSLHARGVILARRGRIDEAIDDYRRAVLMDPSNVRVRAELALLYHRQGLRGQAEREIALAVAVDPAACAPRAARARLRAADGGIGEADALYREVLRDRPSCPEAVTGLAGLLMAAGRKDEAIVVITTALAAGLNRGLLSADPSLRMLKDDPRLAAGVAGGRSTTTVEKNDR